MFVLEIISYQLQLGGGGGGEGGGALFPVLREEKLIEK